ncbi:aconitase family protein, partial [Escherichia coli MP021017.4]
VVADLIGAGAIIRTAFCGPCFGAGDTPINNGLSIRHTTRNFPNREGSKPANALRGQSCGNDTFSLAVYPSSQPVFMDLAKKGVVADLIGAGAIIRTAFCGPCFGAG